MRPAARFAPTPRIVRSAPLSVSSADGPHTPASEAVAMRKPKIHMHPVKRRLLFVLVLGSLLGGVLMVATVRMVVTPMKRWSVSSLDSMTQLGRLDTDIARLHDTTAASALRMKLFLQQLQKLHASSTSRSALVEKAAAQSYREHARDRLREHFMAIKEGILLQTSQRRRIDDARLTLRKMNLTAELLLLRIDADALEEEEISLSASSLLALSIRDIRAAMMEHSLSTPNATMDELAAQVQQALAEVGNFTQLTSPIGAPSHEHEQHGFFVYLTMFGVVGLWLSSVISDERNRKTTFLFTIHRAFVRVLSSLVIVERVIGDSSDDEDY